MAITLKDYAAQIQDPLRQGIVDMLWQSSRIMPLLNFIQWNGLSYPYSKRNKRPGVGTRGLNGQFTIAPGGYAPDIETLAILGGKVQTDTVLMDTKPQLRENEIAGTMEAAGLMYDRLFIKGDPTQPGHANDFYGLYPRITGGQVIAAAADGDTPKNEKVSELLDLVKGPNTEKVLFMPRSARRDLSQDVKANAGGKGVFDVGTQLTSYDNARIVEVEKDEADNEIMPYNEVQGASGAVCTSILCVRLGGAVDERDVQGIITSNLKMQAVGNFGEYILDVIQMVAGMGIFSGFSAARLAGIKKAA